MTPRHRHRHRAVTLTILVSALAGSACGAMSSQYETVRPDVVRGAVVAVKLAACTDAALTEWRQAAAVSATEEVRRSALLGISVAPPAPAPVAPAPAQ